ncbi:MAG: MoaD/ThiS family protein [Deltaproteobacteria bacterium]|nr:MoaD/ThiS family protein [Deltaproteobacteria bacterium]
MQVSVKLFSFLGQIAGTDRLTVDLIEGATVSDLLSSLSIQFGNKLLQNGQIVVLINQKQAFFESILNENDQVLLLPVLGGG